MRGYITLERLKNLNETIENINLIQSLSKARDLNLMEQIEVYYKKEDIKKAIQGDIILLLSKESFELGIFDEIKGGFICLIGVTGEKFTSQFTDFNAYKIIKK